MKWPEKVTARGKISRCALQQGVMCFEVAAMSEENKLQKARELVELTGSVKRTNSGAPRSDAAQHADRVR